MSRFMCVSTMFCAAHGGGKRYQYFEGCDKSARGLTVFCIAHGWGKRRQYFKGWRKGAEGSTRLCFAQHAAGTSDVYIPRVVTRVRPKVRLCFA
jgi:hypothetical protein